MQLCNCRHAYLASPTFIRILASQRMHISVSLLQVLIRCSSKKKKVHPQWESDIKPFTKTILSLQGVEIYHSYVIKSGERMVLKSSFRFASTCRGPKLFIPTKFRSCSMSCDTKIRSKISNWRVENIGIWKEVETSQRSYG